MVKLTIDTAIPCSLIINELVTNSLKYGFPDGRRGEIHVELKQDSSDGAYRLVVCDNGVGLPSSVELRKTTSLGLQPVTTLVDQLNGTIEVKRERYEVHHQVFSDEGRETTQE